MRLSNYDCGSETVHAVMHLVKSEKTIVMNRKIGRKAFLAVKSKSKSQQWSTSDQSNSPIESPTMLGQMMMIMIVVVVVVVVNMINGKQPCANGISLR